MTDKYCSVGKFLKIPKGYSEAIIRKWTDNAMDKIQRTKRKIIVDKLLHRKLKIEQYERN